MIKASLLIGSHLTSNTLSNVFLGNSNLDKLFFSKLIVLSFPDKEIKTFFLLNHQRNAILLDLLKH